MIVVDTNVIAGLFLATEWSEQSEHLLLDQPEWAAPALWRSEFRNVLATYVRVGRLELQASIEAIEAAEELMHGQEFSVASAAVLSLAAESKCTAYDCEFVVLAKHLDAPLVTNDRRVLRVFPETASSLSLTTGAT